METHANRRPKLVHRKYVKGLGSAGPPARGTKITKVFTHVVISRYLRIMGFTPIDSISTSLQYADIRQARGQRRAGVQSQMIV